MISVVIQAGGQSSRMGRDKGLVMLNDKRMIEHVLDAVAGLGDETLVTTNNPDGYGYLGLPMLGDDEPGAGALPGLRTALRGANGDYMLIVACDMPFLNRELLAFIIDQRDGADVVVPKWDGRFQPTHALYRREPCLAAVEDALANNRRRMIGFYGDVRVREISAETVAKFDPIGRTFFNVNTPEDLHLAERVMNSHYTAAQSRG